MSDVVKRHDATGFAIRITHVTFKRPARGPGLANDGSLVPNITTSSDAIQIPLLDYPTAKMFAARLARTQARTALSRQAARRSATTNAPSSGLSGAADNAFNRERAAVKDHAAATSGTISPSSICSVRV